MSLIELQRLVRDLGPDEVAVLLEVARGLQRGRAVYGELELATDRRDFAREALEECRDGLVYAAAGLVRLRRGDHRGR